MEGESKGLLRVVIAGSRTFGDSGLLFRICDEFIDKWLAETGHARVSIISGMARGADALGWHYGISRGYELHAYPAEWGRFGKSAGYIRNKKMASAADCLIAFWDGSSKGTGHMIDCCKKKGLRIAVYDYVRGKIVDAGDMTVGGESMPLI